jgi:hypothetical protein
MDALPQLARDVRFVRRAHYDVPFAGKTIALLVLLSPLLFAVTAPLWGGIVVWAWRLYAHR